MSGEAAGATTGQQGTAGQGTAEQASGQQGTAENGTAEQGAADRGAAEQGAADRGAAEQGAAEQAVAEQGAGQRGAVDAAAPWGTEDVNSAAWQLPWPESPASGTGRPERADLEVAFAAGIRRTGALMQLMGQAAADRIGINATDLNCLNILSFSGHMTAGELARATGLTTASITGVIDRLEEAGFVHRDRDPHDRRRVVVRIVMDKAVGEVASVFLPMLRAWREMSAQYSDDELRLIVDFYGQMEQVFREHIVRLRDS